KSTHQTRLQEINWQYFSELLDPINNPRGRARGIQRKRFIVSFFPFLPRGFASENSLIKAWRISILPRFFILVKLSAHLVPPGAIRAQALKLGHANQPSAYIMLWLNGSFHYGVRFFTGKQVPFPIPQVLTI